MRIIFKDYFQGSVLGISLKLTYGANLLRWCRWLYDATYVR